MDVAEQTRNNLIAEAEKITRRVIRCEPISEDEIAKLEDLDRSIRVQERAMTAVSGQFIMHYSAIQNALEILRIR